MRPAVETILSQLGLDSIELILIHWPTAWKAGDLFFPPHGNSFPSDFGDGLDMDTTTKLTDTWAALEACVDAGLVRAIGVSNFSTEQVDEVLGCVRGCCCCCGFPCAHLRALSLTRDHHWLAATRRACRIKPAVNQVECHPYFNQEQLRKDMAERSVAVTAYSPLGNVWPAPKVRRGVLQIPSSPFAWCFGSLTMVIWFCPIPYAADPTPVAASRPASTTTC